jgi:hypothetical protein
MRRPTTVAIGGFTSEVGKTTLMCHLLAALPGWEAIKTTRGHYRSCGKEPRACCVSHLLSDEPVIRSGREETYSADKDTGRYWQAGAANVHWLIVTEAQVEEGIKRTMERVTAPGVLIEGNSITEFVPLDFMLMVARAEGEKIKSSARRALHRASGLYLSEPDESLPCTDSTLTKAKTKGSGDRSARDRFATWRARTQLDELQPDLPILTHGDIPQVVAELQRIHQVRCRVSGAGYQIGIR